MTYLMVGTFVSGELEPGSLMSFVWPKAGETRATKTKTRAAIIEICKCQTEMYNNFEYMYCLLQPNTNGCDDDGTDSEDDQVCGQVIEISPVLEKDQKISAEACFPSTSQCEMCLFMSQLSNFN